MDLGLDLGFDDLGFGDLGFDDLGFDDLGLTVIPCRSPPGLLKRGVPLCESEGEFRTEESEEIDSIELDAFESDSVASDFDPEVDSEATDEDARADAADVDLDLLGLALLLLPFSDVSSPVIRNDDGLPTVFDKPSLSDCVLEKSSAECSSRSRSPWSSTVRCTEEEESVSVLPNLIG